MPGTGWTGAIAVALALLAADTSANPQGATVVGGQATVTQAPGRTTIHQQSERAIIDWKSFDIDRGEVTHFIQPGSGSIALNRIGGNKPSQIDGRLEANGHVWLVNPRGVVFGPTATVDVHGIVATPTDILDGDFLNGRFGFSVPSADPGASVLNQGTISIGETGLAALVAPHVRNDGAIFGTLGQVVLAGTPTFALDFHGDGLIRFVATAKVLESLDPSRALVENAGTIRVDGGRVLLTAEAAGGVVDEVINTSGIVEARTVSKSGGVIVLHGGDAGVVTVSGQLLATGIGPEADGGDIRITGERVLLAGGAHLDVSGGSGGGRVRVGGDPRGGDGDRATQTTVAAGATIAADATVAGDGGDVVVWADRRLVFAGAISARGGPTGGDGGRVETSSPAELVATGRVDTSAAAGAAGEWLIDPLVVTIVDGPGDADLPVFAADPPVNGKATVSAQAIAAATGTVVIEATGSVVLDAPIVTPHDVVLRAGTVNVGSSITTPGTVTIVAKDVISPGDAVITAQRLNLHGLPGGDPAGGSVDIKTQVANLTIGPEGPGGTGFSAAAIENSGNLVIDGETPGGVTTGSLRLTVTGTLTLERPIGADAGGDAIVLVIDRLVNAVGPGVFATPNGRTLIYSQNPKTDVTNGIPATIILRESIETLPPEALPPTGNVIVYATTGVPELPPLSQQELNVITDPIVVSTQQLGSSEAATLAVPSPTMFSVPAAVDRTGSQDLLFSNDGNSELWGLSGPH
ncbi:MAG: filamentous hemagglutinin N-terminal domain-containing protein [Rhodospirillales bacterium]